MTQVAVIGIGQSLRGDDAAGLEAVRQWEQRFPETASRPELTVGLEELPGLTLLDRLAQVEAAILVDAVQSAATPGAIHRLAAEELATFGSDSKSAHGWGLAETLELGCQLGTLTTRIRIIGLEAAQLEIGADLSPAVRAALPEASAAIQAELLDLLK